LQEILQLLSNIFGFGNNGDWRDLIIVIMMFWLFYGGLGWVFEKPAIAKHFSNSFVNTLLVVGAIVLFATINQGQALRIREEIIADTFFGLLFVFGSWLGWVILSILVTYIVRLFFPLFKWIHKKSQ
jgi:hypothetical protein|tara:strand:- start:2329 stop:2709 length:381 start_codon:yes stop_codon:yes gene_type:complete